MPWAAFRWVVGALDVGRGTGGAALRHHVPGTPFTLAALCGDAEFELDLVKAQARAGVAGNFAVGDSAADTDDHGIGLLVVKSMVEV